MITFHLQIGNAIFRRRVEPPGEVGGVPPGEGLAEDLRSGRKGGDQESGGDTSLRTGDIQARRSAGGDICKSAKLLT